MARPKSAHPTELELQILKVLWQRSPMPVRDVRDALAAAGPRSGPYLGHYDAQHDGAEKVPAPHDARQRLPVRAPPQPRRSLAADVGRLVSRVFDGSAKAVVLSLFDSTDLSAADVKELAASVEPKNKGAAR